MDALKINFLKQIGPSLCIARKSAGFSRVDAAKALNISEDTLYAYETGKREITSDICINMADLYGTTVENLTKYKELAKQL
jgi:DNA-binding XRE family transcriptional regulator